MSFFNCDRLQAYQDRPYKMSFIHISCPHMYVTVLEALELKKGQSFLNVGSGSGYLSCLVSYITGVTGLNHGIDANAEVVEHSRSCINLWLEKLQKKNPKAQKDPTSMTQDRISIVHGNCFDVDVTTSTNFCKYDRIYVGAGCPDMLKSFFYEMLADDGIMIVPLNGE